jgi:pilus assembly protein Flp/PilA
MLGWIKKFKKDQSGATAIEYVMIASIITVAILAGVTSIGGSLNQFFVDVGKAFTK